MSGGVSTGRLAVVGTGPGSPDQLTGAALRELAGAELVVGYRGYLERLPVELAPGRREAYPLGKERERARRALAAAAAGARVALISGGDAGIYGMASIAVEEALSMGPGAPPLVVVPGVTAATAAAALLGAPLSADFACLSLSDLSTSRAGLLARLEALAAVDIVLVLYNPASRLRREPWQAAVEALRRHRPATTPAAAVRRAYREGEEVVVTEVGSLERLEVDMETTVIVGCARTRRRGAWLYTAREKTER